ncbi:MAG: hypothetical protein ABI748_01130 [Dokdonella sp.]
MTTSRDRDQDLNRLLDDDGGEFGTLYRRLPRAEPPRRLDRAVLGNAARAVHGQTPYRHRWVVGFGSVAGVVLAAGIAWHVGQDALRQQSLNESGTGAAVVIPVQPITSTKHRHTTDAMKVDSTALAPMPAEPEPTAKAAKPQIMAPQVRAKSESVPPMPRPTPPPAAPMATPAPFPVAPTQSTNAPPAADAARGRAGDSTRAAPAQTSELREQSAPTRMRGSGAPAPSSSLELRRDMQLAPDDWLAHIRQLLHQDRRQQATESLRLFHATHPQHPLPADLQALLE